MTTITTLSSFERFIIDDLEDDLVDVVNRLAENLSQKSRRNLLRSSYYDGKRACRQVSAVMPPQYRNLGIVLGWTAKAVDLLARRCNLDGFVWPGNDIDAIGGREVWDQNMLGAEVDQGLSSSLIHSTAFVITTAGGDGEPDALIHFKDALNATGTWNGRARRLDNLLSITDRDDDGAMSELVLYLPAETITLEHDGGRRWAVVDRRGHLLGMPAEVLPYRPRLGRPFGTSRISRPIMALQDQAVRELIRLEGHMDVYSFPELWMLGADESIFKNPDGTQKASWAVMLGRIKGIPDDDDAMNPRADVKQFPASDPKPHLAALNGFAKLMAREASLPDTALAITDVSNPTSAESYDASQYELIAEAEGATDDYSPALRRSFVRALAIANGETSIPPEWSSIDCMWRDPRFESRAAAADAGMKQLAAMPWLAETEVGLELLGLDDQQRRRAIAERRRTSARTTATALAGLGDDGTDG